MTRVCLCQLSRPPEHWFLAFIDFKYCGIEVRITFGHSLIWIDQWEKLQWFMNFFAIHQSEVRRGKERRGVGKLCRSAAARWQSVLQFRKSNYPPPGPGYRVPTPGLHAAPDCTQANILHLGTVTISAWKRSIRRFVITEKAPTRAFSWLKAATTTSTFKTLLRHYDAIIIKDGQFG